MVRVSKGAPFGGANDDLQAAIVETLISNLKRQTMLLEWIRERTADYGAPKAGMIPETSEQHLRIAGRLLSELASAFRAVAGEDQLIERLLFLISTDTARRN